MVKRTLLVLSLGFFAYFAAAQQNSSGKLLSNPVLSQVPVLKSLAFQIDSAENVQFKNCRENASIAKEKVVLLYDAYEKELQNLKNDHLQDPLILDAIKKELQLVQTKKQ